MVKDVYGGKEKFNEPTRLAKTNRCDVVFVPRRDLPDPPKEQ